MDSFLDDRMDPVLSTRAACAYLRYLYRMFGDGRQVQGYLDDRAVRGLHHGHRVGQESHRAHPHGSGGERSEELV